MASALHPPMLSTLPQGPELSAKVLIPLSKPEGANQMEESSAQGC